jgi:hypothetical protein
MWFILNLFISNKTMTFEFIINIFLTKYIMELEKFKSEMSNRRKIDIKTIHYWSFISNNIRKEITIKYNEFEDILEFNVKIEGMKKELTDNTFSMLDIGITIWNNKLVDEFNLRWNNFIIECCNSLDRFWHQFY